MQNNSPRRAPHGEHTLQGLQAGQFRLCNRHAACAGYSPLDWLILRGVQKIMGCIMFNMQWYEPFSRLSTVKP